MKSLIHNHPEMRYTIKCGFCGHVLFDEIPDTSDSEGGE
jgi:hypothetical protein